MKLKLLKLQILLNAIVLAGLIFLITSIAGCMTTTTVVGDHDKQTGEVYVYDEVRQAWLFWGIIPINKARATIPDDGSYKLVTHRNGLDCVVEILTGGIVVTYTITVEDKK